MNRPHWTARVAAEIGREQADLHAEALIPQLRLRVRHEPTLLAGLQAMADAYSKRVAEIIAEVKAGDR